MACLDENALAAYIARTLPESESTGIEAHLATCNACRALVADLAGLETDEPPADGAPAGTSDVLARGAIVGRYVVLRVLGRGGFGVVYAAYDPTLDRTVALKLLRAGAIDSTDVKDRLVREARAMARVSDAHVVGVHDAGEVDGQVFIAMELFDGKNLRDWLADARPPWREVLRVFLDAGRGLAAAHAAGIVHRDFKPANVIRRTDGRVAVTDFGLARRRSLDAPDTAAPEPVAGTLAYMSPEQLRGEAATPLSDQFAFAVALHEALAGQHPFAGRGATEVARSVRTGERRSGGAASGAPARVRRALDRALSPAPGDRFPSMDALLRALTPAPRPHAALVVAAGVAVVLAAWVGVKGVERAGLCKGSEARMGEVWNDAVRADLAHSFTAGDARFAEEEWQSFARRLDIYATRWSSLHTAACVATRIRGEQSEAALDAKMTCLERKRLEVRTLVDELRAGLREPDASHAVHLPATLPDLGECEDVASLLAPSPPPRASRDEIAAVRGRLAEASARRSVGNTTAADALVADALARAQKVDYAPLLAEALLANADGLALRGDVPGAQESLRAAIRSAGRGRHDRAAAEAWVELVYVAGVLGRASDAGFALEVGALAALDRTSGSETLAARLASAMGLLEARRGHFDRALARHRDAVRLYAEAGGTGAPEIGPELARVAEMLAELGQWDDAAAEAERARDRVAASFGEHHALTALPLTVLARCACARADATACTTLAERALAVRATPSTSPEDPTFLPILLVHARAMSLAGRFDAAQADLSAARSIALGAFGPRDAWMGVVGTAIGEALTLHGDYALAIETLRESEEILRQAVGPDHPDTTAAGAALDAAGKLLPVPTSSRSGRE